MEDWLHQEEIRQKEEKSRQIIVDQQVRVKQQKKLCSLESYIGDLKENDLRGYCAAGIMLFTRHRKHLVFISEMRDNIKKLNFIGGKRNFDDQTPWMTAKREFLEETGRRLPELDLYQQRNQLTQLFWAPSKYVLIEHYATRTFLKEFPSWLVSVPTETIQTLKDKNELKSMFHPFVVGMLNFINFK